MKRLTIMLKPSSSLCNMRCGYCFYSDVAASRHEKSMGFMTRETASAIIRNVYCEMLPGDAVTFAFQGGEPGLAGLDFFRFFTAEVKGAAPPGVGTNYAFQTNGLMVDGEWAAFFKDNGFLVGLSLDGDAALHNRNRSDREGKGTFNRVMEAKRTMDRHGTMYNILCVLTAESARRAGRVWDFIKSENIRYIQFIPCLEALDGEPHPAALTSERFYRFYTALFPLWRDEALRGNVVCVRLFEDLAGIYLTGRGITCGVSGRCSPQIAVEADGGVYPCDFYMLDENRVGDLNRQSIREVFEAVVGSGFYTGVPPAPEACADCAYNRWCGGGCRRLARAVYNGAYDGGQGGRQSGSLSGGQSGGQGCGQGGGQGCGMRMFLDERLEDLLATVKRLT